MSSQAWKDLERRMCRLFGAERRPSTGPYGWARGSDDDGTCPFALETKRTTRPQIRAAWLEQARRNAKDTDRPWILIVSEHRDRRPIAVVDVYWLAEVCQQAGLLPELEIAP